MGWTIRTLRFLLTGCLSLFVSVVLPNAKGQSVEALLQQAAAAEDRGDVSKALGLYEALAKQQPDSIPIRANYGAALAKAGRYDEAIFQYREALKRDSVNRLVRLNLALAYFKEASFATAINELEPLHKEQPENEQVILLLADSYLRLGRNADVIALLTPVHDRNSADQAVNYALGTALIREGKIQQGEAVLDIILRNANSPEANLLLGEAQFAAADYERAAETLRKATADANLPAWSLYGRALLQLRDLAGAKAAFDRALQLDANDFDANLYLGAVLHREGQNKEALPYIQKALRLRPASPQALFQIAALHAATGDLEKARQEFEKLEREWPDFLEVHIQLASLYARIDLKQESERERRIVLNLSQKADSASSGKKP